METRACAVMRRDDGRYVITKAETCEVIDNAPGYGDKTRQHAEQAASYKCKGGKAKKDAEKREATAFWRQHEDCGSAAQKYDEPWCKESARGETDPDAALVHLAPEIGVEGFKKQSVAYLP